MEGEEGKPEDGRGKMKGGGWKGEDERVRMRGPLRKRIEGGGLKEENGNGKIEGREWKEEDERQMMGGGRWKAKPEEGRLRMDDIGWRGWKAEDGTV